MRRFAITLLCSATLLGCRSDTFDAPSEDVATEPAPALPGTRSINRARGAADAATERALRHDSIR